ncbi:Cytochrome P450 4V2 [Aphelenchoides bicaudatus]|nr:Cytochrome P450 4V2 [Aphelenchoides bicaudatus]
MAFGIWTVFLIVIVLFHRQLFRFLYERARLWWYVGKMSGPFAIPLLGSTWQLKWKIDALANQLREWFMYYKNTKADLVRFWIGPIPLITCFSADAVKVVLESQTVLKKGSEYDIVQRWLGTGLLISTGEKWRTRRKLLTPAFHFNMLNKFHASHDREAQILVKQLEVFAESGKEFDAYPFLKRCALDIICDTAMGVKVNAQTNHEHPYVNAVKRITEISFTYSRQPWLWFSPIWYALGYGYEYDQNLKMVTDFTRKVIADRQKTFEPIPLNDGDPQLENNRKRYAFLDLLLSVQKEGNMTDEDIRHDTTSSGMAWALWLLAFHQKYQERIFEEVDKVFGDSDRECTIDDLKQLRYLEQCIKESLRLFPPFTRKVEEDFECVGYKIPRGATVLINPNAVQIDERYFPDPMVYNPDNFTPDACSSRHPFAFVPFSAGPRNCIGQKFALMEEKTILSWIFRYYRISSDIPFEANIPCPEIINKPYLGVPIRLERRR